MTYQALTCDRFHHKGKMTLQRLLTKMRFHITEMRFYAESTRDQYKGGHHDYGHA